MADIFDLDDLASYLQTDVDAATATTARLVATGWLNGATRRDWRQAPVIPAEIQAWGLELAALAYTNPEGLTGESVGGYSNTQFGVHLRRTEILTAAQARYPRRGGSLISAQTVNTDPSAVRGWPVVL